MNRTIAFEEQLFPYDHDVYVRWGAADGRMVGDALKVTGPLGKSVESYANQARSGTGHQHYPEVSYARHLIETRAFPRDAIVYENFRVSARMRGEVRDPSNFFAAGTKRVADVFSDEFFARFDALCEANRGGPKEIEGARLDLFACDAGRRLAGFWEIKRYPLSGHQTEEIHARQLQALAFIRHLVEEERSRVLRDPGYTVEVALVAFVPRGRAIEAKSHPVTFNLA